MNRGHNIKIDDGVLRAYLDNALPPQAMAQIEASLAHSSQMRTKLAQIRQDKVHAETLIQTLSPTHIPAVSDTVALYRLQAQPAQKSPNLQPKLGAISLAERISPMFSKLFFKRYQPAITALVVIFVLAIAFSFAPVRAFAGDLLRIFRVQEVRVLPIDPGRLEELKDNQEFSNLMDQFSTMKEVVVDGGEPQPFASLDEATAIVDFNVAKITAPPEGVGNLSEVNVHLKSIYRVRLNPDLIEAIFGAAGVTVDLPDSLQDEAITVTRPTMLTQAWQNDAALSLGFAQLEAPHIEYPDDLDLDALGVAGLQVLGFSETEAEALGETIDWANTLLMPIPSDGRAEVSEVLINGQKGLLFVRMDGQKQETGLMWQAESMTYLLTGNYSADALIAAAESIQ